MVKQKKLIIEWLDYLDLVQEGALYFKKHHPEIDTIVQISRGGLIPGRILAEHLGVKRVFSFGINFYNYKNKLKKVPDVYQPLPESFWSDHILVVDDIIESASSIQHILKFIERRYCTNNKVLTYSVFYKLGKSMFEPTHTSKPIAEDAWIVMPYEME